MNKLQEQVILIIIGLCLSLGVLVLLCMLPFFILWDWYSSKEDVDKVLRDKAQLIHLKRGSLGS